MKKINTIAEAAHLLSQGKLVAFPTETVYGLGADASNPEAIKRIFAAKGRPSDHPVIVHIYDLSELNRWAKAIPKEAYLLAKHFWPGALTLILSVAEGVSPALTGGQDTIGVRMPSHPVARELLRVFGRAIAAPSANRFGRISPTAATHVQEELGSNVAMVLEGGECLLGIESTIMDLTQTPPALLRPGPLNKAFIESVAGITISGATKQSPRVSGSLASHYAPEARVKLVNAVILALLENTEQPRGVMSFHEKPDGIKATAWQKMPMDAKAYAHMLYATLREMDAQGVEVIWVEHPPTTVEWEGVNDRLKRASAR